MKAVVAAFNQEKALVGAFSVIVQFHRLIVYSTSLGVDVRPPAAQLHAPLLHHPHEGRQRVAPSQRGRHGDVAALGHESIDSCQHKHKWEVLEVPTVAGVVF